MMRRYLFAMLLFVPSLCFAITPVTITSASINYTTHTITVEGAGFCISTLPVVTFNTTRLKVTSACSPSVVVASLPVQVAGSYRLIIANSGGASATFYVTYGAVGPQGIKGSTGAMGPIGLTGATGATGGTGLQGPIGLTGAQGAAGAAGPQGPAGANGTGFNFRNAFDPAVTYAINDVVTYSGSTYLANVANGPSRAADDPSKLTPDVNTSAWAVMAAAGAPGAAVSVVASGSPSCPTGGDTLTDANGNITFICNGAPGAMGPQGVSGTNGTNGVPGPQGAQGAPGNNGTNGTNGTGFNFRGAFNTSNTYAVNDVVTFISPDITYNVNLPFGSAGSMVGTVTTDGTQGVLSSSNIVSWNLTLFDGTNTTVLTPATSTSAWYGTDLTATPTSLLFNYNVGDNGYGSFSGSGGQFCITSQTNCFGPANTYGSWGVGGDSWVYSYGSGAQAIATGGATGGTSTYVAIMAVPAGGIAPGVTNGQAIPWAMVAQAGTNGTNGTNGANGTNGTNGVNGLPGIQGNPGINGQPGINGINGTNGLDGKSFVWRGAFDINISMSNGYAVNDVVIDGGSAYICTDPTPLTQGQTPSSQPQTWSLMVQGMGTAYTKSRLSQGGIPDITRTNLYPPVNVLELPSGTFLVSARVTVISQTTDPNVVACIMQANPYNPSNPQNDWVYVTVGPGPAQQFGTTPTYATITAAQDVLIGPTEAQLICYAFDPIQGSPVLAGDVQVNSTVMTAIPTGGFIAQ